MTGNIYLIVRIYRFLDKNIYYANFDWDQQSYLRTPNPFNLNSNESSVSLWMRLSRLSDSGAYSTSTLFECGDTILARINGTKIIMSFTTKSAASAQLDKLFKVRHGL